MNYNDLLNDTHGRRLIEAVEEIKSDLRANPNDEDKKNLLLAAKHDLYDYAGFWYE